MFQIPRNWENSQSLATLLLTLKVPLYVGLRPKIASTAVACPTAQIYVNINVNINLDSINVNISQMVWGDLKRTCSAQLVLL